MNATDVLHPRLLRSKIRDHLQSPDGAAERLYRKGYARSLALEKENHHKQQIHYPIDFVVTWVDLTDPAWQAEKESYYRQLNKQDQGNNAPARYRDWGLFPYWFRAVERYAPWVRYVWLVTCGHTPAWLNMNHPKLRIARHEEFIPREYLPTFNTQCIELNLWRIPELSEHFVYFNDDMYLFSDVKKEDFFTGELPNYCAVAKPLWPHEHMTSFEHKLLNNLGLFNSSFRLRDVMREAPEKWFSCQYGEDAIYNQMAYITGYLTGMFFPHLPVPQRKSSMEVCYRAFSQSFDCTCRNRFRSMYDISNRVFEIWDMMHNTFEPVSAKHYGIFFNHTPDKLGAIRKAFAKKRAYKCICLNDCEAVQEKDYQTVKTSLLRLMDKKLPKKSSYEK